MTNTKPAWLRPALILTLLVGFALRLTSLNLQNIWWDEARNLDVALRPFLQVATAPELDIQPPLYYYLLHGWLGVNGISIGDEPATLAWLARFVSLFFGLLLIPLVGQLARRIGGNFAFLSAATIGALSPFWLAESQETRMYTVVLALLTCAALALLTALQRENARALPGVAPDALGPRTPYVVFILASAAAFLVHYNAVFVLIAWYLWWLFAALLQRGDTQLPLWTRLKPLLFSGIATTLLVLPIAPIALRQIPGYGNPNLVVPTVSDYLAQNFTGHLAGYAWDAAALFGYANWWLWASFGVAIAGILLLCLRQRNLPRFWRELAFLLVWFAGGLFLYYLAVMDRGAFNIRYSAMVTPALIALLGAGVAGWNLRRRLPLGWLALILLVGGMIPFIRSDLTDPRYFREDMQGVTDWLRENTRASDIILVDQKYPFAFYYDNYVIAEDAAPEGVEVAPARYLFVDINTLANRLSTWATDAERIFWVQWFESDTDPRHAVPFLLDQNGAHAGEEWFQGWSIDWWNLNPPNHFALGEALAPLFLRFTNPDGAPAVQTVEASIPVTATASGGVPVVIRWQRTPDSGAIRPLKARVALYDAADNRLAQADERILNDRHLAPAEWRAEDASLNVYLAAPDAPLPAGVYSVRLLVYDADTLEPLTLLDAAGNPAGIEATLGEVRIE